MQELCSFHVIDIIIYILTHLIDNLHNVGSCFLIFVIINQSRRVIYVFQLLYQNKFCIIQPRPR